MSPLTKLVSRASALASDLRFLPLAKAQNINNRYSLICRNLANFDAAAAISSRRDQSTVAAPTLDDATTAAATRLKSILDEQLESIRSAGTWKSERVIVSKQATEIQVAGSEDRGQILNFCANNYLGLSSHPEVIDAGKAALDSHGAGLSSVRFICGTQDIHKELEAKIAAFHGKEDAILYASCFDANAGLFEVMTTPEDAILSDELNHASIIDGIRLCKARKWRYKHRDLQDLEAKLVEAKDAR